MRGKVVEMRTYKNTRKPKKSEKAPIDLVADRPMSYGKKFETAEVIAAKSLGIAKNFSNDFMLIEATRNGIKKNVLIAISKQLGINQEKLCELLHISTKTFQRIEDETVLDIFSSELAIELALVNAKAGLVFSDTNAIQIWLKTPLLALNGQTPLSILDTSFGVKLVMQTLGRIEHGVYA